MKFPAVSLAAVVLAGAVSISRAADQPQWGQAWTRNLVSPEVNLPASFDLETGRNIKWTAELGTQTHSTPVVAGGRIYIGTNNSTPRDPKHKGDRGVLMCLNEADGRLLWQLVVPKRIEDRFFDWPKSGISSPATVEGDRVYIVSNRGEVMCLDAKGLADGNDGPFQDEARHMTPAEEAPLKLGPLDADILWLFDLTEGAGIWSHDAACSSILIRGDHLYLNTGTGVDNTHVKIRRPDAPSLVALDKRTGRLLAREREGIGPNIFHCTWSPPAMAKVNGRELIFFAAGNGILYAFKPLAATPPPGRVETFEKVWSYDPDPSAPKTKVHQYNRNRSVSPSNVFGMPVVVGERIWFAGGGDIWWGKEEAWIQCVRAGGEGDITKAGQVWSHPLEKHVMSTPAVHEGLVFIADVGKNVHCLDAETGETYWTHQAGGLFWASPMVADGKVYIGTRQGDFHVFAAAREKRLLFSTVFPRPISATPVAANGVLYIATMDRLHAIANPTNL